VDAMGNTVLRVSPTCVLQTNGSQSLNAYSVRPLGRPPSSFTTYRAPMHQRGLKRMNPERNLLNRAFSFVRRRIFSGCGALSGNPAKSAVTSAGVEDIR